MRISDWSSDVCSSDLHMRIERVVLEHHGNVALLWRNAVHHQVTDADLACRDALEAGDHPQECRLAAARWANQNDKLAIGNIYRDAVDDLGGAERLADIARSEERRVGKECGSTCGYRWSP